MPLNHSLRALQVLRAANAALENATQEQQLLDEVCHIAIAVGGYRFAWFGYPLNDAAKSVRFVASAGHHPDYLQKIRITWDESPTGEGPAGVAIRTQRPAIEQHIAESTKFTPWRDMALAYGYHSVIALPLTWHGQILGCLAILSADADAFDTEEAALLTELASSVSYGINALRTKAAHEQTAAILRTERDTQDVLRRILNLSLENISLEQKLDRTLQLLFDIPWLTLERKGSVFLVNEGSDTLRLVSRRHLSPVLHELCGTVPFGHCLCGRAAASGELVYKQHLDAHHDTHFDGIDDHGHYCQPIRSSRGVVGILNLYLAAGHQRNPLEVNFLAAVADTLAGVIEREQAELAQKRLVALLETTPDQVTITDTHGNCLYCNASARALFTHPGEALNCSGNIFSHFPQSVVQQMRDVAYPIAMAEGLWEGEAEINHHNAERLPVSLLIMSHRDSSGEIAYLSTTARDISDRIRAERTAQALALREQHFANSLINSLPGIFYMIDSSGRLLRWNSNLARTLGYQTQQLDGMPLSELVVRDCWQRMERTCDDTLATGSAVIELELATRQGEQLPYYITNTLVEHSDTGKAIVGIGIDISYRKQLERELRQRATIDPLTGIYNRLKMEETLEQELARSRRYHTPLSIAMFDIDYFKRINDTYGHEAGDEVLRAFASITRAQLRDVDFLARWGGEEFMIISIETTVEDMQRLAERVRAAVEKGQTMPGIAITASFGVGQFSGSESQKELLKRVDDALYLAKSGGRNQVRIAS